MTGAATPPAEVSVAELAAQLRQIVGSDHVLVDAEVESVYERDLTGRLSGDALLVVRPADTSEVAAVLATCTGAGTCVVPQGGHTGMVGGATPREMARWFSLTRLQHVAPIGASSSQVTLGAGMTLGAFSTMPALPDSSYRLISVPEVPRRLAA